MKFRENMDRPILDLKGPDGNAYALMGYAKQFGKQLGKDYNKIVQEMIKGDYKNLLKVFEAHFGEYVILEGK